MGGPALLPAFEAIVPCGIQDEKLGVTSMEAQLRKPYMQHHEEQPESRLSPQGADPAKQMCNSTEDAQRLQPADTHTGTALSVVYVSHLLEQAFAEHFGYREVSRQIQPPT